MSEVCMARTHSAAGRLAVQQVQEVRRDGVVVGFDSMRLPLRGEVVPVEQHEPSEAMRRSAMSRGRFHHGVRLGSGSTRSEHGDAGAQDVHGMRGGGKSSSDLYARGKAAQAGSFCLYSAARHVGSLPWRGGGDFFELAVRGEVEDVVAAIVQVVAVAADGAEAVLPAGVPERATDFFGLNLGEERRLAELGDVGEDGDADALLKFGVHCKLSDGFGEDHVCTGFDVRGGTVDRSGKAFLREGIGPCHNDETGIGASIDGGLDAVDHLARAHNLFAGSVAAALRSYLIFHVDGSRTGLGHGADGARDVECTTPAGVDIDEQRKGRHFSDAAHIGQDIFHGGDAEVRHSERVCRDAAA
jgi:hypothetical protein